MKKNKLLIFDLDGVLIDACDWHKNALNKSLVYHGYEPIKDDDHYRIFNGLPTREKLKILNIPKEQHQSINELKQEYTKDLISQNTLVSIEKIELINSIKNLGFFVACYTNSITETAKLMLRKVGILDLMDLLVTNEMVDNPKPNPEGYLKVMDHFNVAPSHTIIVEDSQKGIEAATNSGANVFIVRDSTETTKTRLIPICRRM
jgi:beta-phosphoglucomutase